MIDRYLDAGGNFIDTANFYTHGHSESIIGDHIGSVPSRRHRTVVATKFFSSLYTGDPNAGGANRKAIARSCDDSLRRLRTDFIDLYWMHVWDRFTPIDETMRALDDLVATEKVRYIGFSDTPAWKVAQAQTLDFAARSVKGAGSFGYGGTTINGEAFPVNPLAPADDRERH